jgi:predicted  nucleic acid-binding Zn-ribbon protein
VQVSGMYVQVKEVGLKKQLELLFRLQTIDSNIKRTETLQRQFEEEVKRLQGELDRETQKSAEAKLAVDELVKKHREHEGALKVLEDQKSKVQQKMMAIKTNKEFAAAQHEISSIEQAIGKKEEEIILAMDAVEDSKGVITSADQAQQQAQQRFDEKKKQAETELRDFLADVEKQREEREALLREIAPDILRTYQQIYKARNGTAVALADNEQCFGCSMKIPPQVYNEVVQGDQLHTCPNCRRILYVDRAGTQDRQTACDQTG